MNRTVEEGREIRYGFRISGKDGLNKALAEAIKEVSPEAATQVLKRVMRGKYSDCTFPEETEAGKPDLMDCHIAWRGGLRRGHVFWQTGKRGYAPAAAPEFLDWEMFIGFEDEAPANAGTDDIPTVYWQAGALVRDEIDTLLRYHVLLTRSDLPEEYGEQVRAAGHAHAIAAEKIWSRSFLQDGKLVIDGFDYNLTEEARTAQSLSKYFRHNARAALRDAVPGAPIFYPAAWNDRGFDAGKRLFQRRRSRILQKYRNWPRLLRCRSVWSTGAARSTYRNRKKTCWHCRWSRRSYRF